MQRVMRATAMAGEMRLPMRARNGRKRKTESGKWKAGIERKGRNLAWVRGFGQFVNDHLPVLTI